MKTNHVHFAPETIQTFCQKWRIRELALFGSVLREDFGPKSDVDVLVEFEDNAEWDLFDFVDVRDELEQLFGRAVDVVEKPALRNSIRRRNILNTMEIVYAK